MSASCNLIEHVVEGGWMMMILMKAIDDADIKVFISQGIDELS
jgi:hypothetical protein